MNFYFPPKVLATSKIEISGVFSIIHRMKPVSEEITEVFPTILRKIIHFHDFYVDRRNFSGYLLAKTSKNEFLFIPKSFSN